MEPLKKPHRDPLVEALQKLYRDLIIIEPLQSSYGAMVSCWVGSFSFELCCSGTWGVGLAHLGVHLVYGVGLRPGLGCRVEALGLRLQKFRVRTRFP